MSEPNDVAFVVLQGDPATSKSRLSSVLSSPQRTALTRFCLHRITTLVNQNSLYLLAENQQAADEGHRFAITSILQEGDDLNAALRSFINSPALQGYRCVTILPNDLPFLATLEPYTLRPTQAVCFITPDSHLSGTNLLRIPTAAQDPIFAYGQNSFLHHAQGARARGLDVEVTPCPRALDIDTPDDLILAQETFPDSELWELL
ncbi:hypothetical protein [Ferrimicrobium sp.]|uniref:hypothetical protein n=1 Tax=Ferrimicrobium sp. TaxID=2926050 RepID=UPI0026298C37|nr:hypothetical protein [Ferrimicrobium sp.]